MKRTFARHTSSGEARPTITACNETHVENQEDREEVVYDCDCDRSTGETPFELLKMSLDEAGMRCKEKAS